MFEGKAAIFLEVEAFILDFPAQPAGLIGEVGAFVERKVKLVNHLNLVDWSGLSGVVSTHSSTLSAWVRCRYRCRRSHSSSDRFVNALANSISCRFSGGRASKASNSWLTLGKSSSVNPIKYFQSFLSHTSSVGPPANSPSSKKQN